MTAAFACASGRAANQVNSAFSLFPLPQPLPRLPVPGRAGRADRTRHHPDQVVGQLAFPAIAVQAGFLRGPDIPGRRLHVHPRAGRRRTLAQPRQPRTQDLFHLCHQDLQGRWLLVPRSTAGSAGCFSGGAGEQQGDVVPGAGAEASQHAVAQVVQ